MSTAQPLATLARPAGSAAPVLLALENVVVRFGRFVAVREVTFALHAGDLLGLIGPNGAGKTTTLRAAAGLQPLDGGSVRILDQNIRTQPTVIGRHLGFAPDTPALYDGLTVVQFLDFIGAAYGLDSATRSARIEYWLEQLWLTEKRAAVIKSLSRGMRQRLAVARTLLPDPHVILLDEPAAGLDPAGRVQFRRMLANLRDQGKALIVSSHILADLAEYCTHIGIMEQGRLKQFGTVAEVAGGAGSAQRQHFRIVLARRIGDLAPRIATLPGVTAVQLDGDVLTLEYESTKDAAAELLARLIGAGLPVAEFRPISPDIEQAYLRSGIAQVD